MAAEAPRVDVENLCWALAHVTHVLKTRLTAALEGLHVSPRGHHVLFKATKGEFTQTELARMTGLDKTTMVVTLDELEAAGLAKRRPATHDRRAHVIAVTEAGRRKVDEGMEIAAAMTEDVLSVLPAADREVFLESLTRLLSGPLAEPADCAQPVRQREPRRVAAAR
jgi:MarR family transcriptional regulator, transcriptional regulator for hemolysin